MVKFYKIKTTVNSIYELFVFVVSLMYFTMNKCWRYVLYYGINGRFNLSKNQLQYKYRALPFNVQKLMCSSLSVESLSQSRVTSFTKMLLEHRSCAHSSIMVEVNSYYSLFHLCKLIEKFTKAKKIFYQKTSSGKQYFLIECENPSSMRILLDECKYLQLESLPVYSRIIKFDSKSIDKEKSLSIPCEVLSTPLEDVIFKNLLDANDISHQMLELRRCEKLSELDIRLRFFVCSLIEDCISGLFPRAICLPFGSAVNGFGRYSGDLDMNLQLCNEQKETETALYFISKPMLTNNKVQLQRILETFADILQVFVPDVSHMARILKARVPILKFQQETAGVWCDLTVNNKSAINMAELLFTYGELDPHVRPLVYTIRRWASKNKLTSDVPSAQITNFSLLLMVIFFLQNHPRQQLPSMIQLKKLIEKENSSEDNKISNLQIYNLIEKKNLTEDTKISNAEINNLDSLLKEFFAFYATFNFENNALSLLKAQITPKPDYSSIYIHNPIELGFNVSKNVNSDELNKLTVAMQTALWQLENCNRSGQYEPWGILKIFDEKLEKRYWKTKKNKFQIKTVFNKESNDFYENDNNKDSTFIHKVENNSVNNYLEREGKKKLQIKSLFNKQKIGFNENNSNENSSFIHEVEHNTVNNYLEKRGRKAKKRK